jgi:hypothetical protein
MKYGAAKDSGEMIYVPSFIQIVSGIRKLSGGFTDTQTAR